MGNPFAKSKGGTKMICTVTDKTYTSPEIKSRKAIAEK
jgi:hypothetical protein